jgi:hypothetical protein
VNTTWLAPSAALVLIALMSLIPWRTPAADSSESPPRFTLSIPAAFDKSVTVKRYRKGEDIFPPYGLITVAPMTAYHGGYGPPTADQRYKHSWTVSIYAVRNTKVSAAYAKARDGFEADLNETRVFHGWERVATFDTFARFRRKHFPWGDAVSFLHTEYQDGPDTGKYVPDNDHLRYEVWGVTRDRQYTVVASVHVSHPKLANWPHVREVESIEAFKQDRDVKLIETGNPKQFEPNLAAFDELVSSLKMQ